MHLAMKKCNFKRWRKYTGVDTESISALCAETSQTMQQCYDSADRHKGTITRIKQALNGTGSMVEIAWVTVCWGVMVCNQGWPCRWRWFLLLRHPCLSNCTPSHPKHGVLIFSARKNAVQNIFQSAGLWHCFVGWVVLSISKDYSVFVFKVWKAKNNCYYNILAGQDDQILNSCLDISHPCAQCITIMLEGIKVKVVSLFSLADTHRHFRVLATSIIRVMEVTRFLWRCYISTSLQWLDQGDTQHFLEISAKIWFIWDCKFRYLIVVCVSSLTVRVSVNKSDDVIVCLWLRSELLTAVTCLPPPCSLMDMCQDCNWAQGNQT